MHLSELKTLHISQLLDMAMELEIDNAQRMRKQELMFAILKKRAKAGEQIFGDGTLEVLPDGFGFLRSPDTSYLASTDDIYISPSQIRVRMMCMYPLHRSAALICTRATPLKAKCVRPKTTNATLRL